MGLTVKKNTAFAVMVEVTEGTYVAPASATDYVQTLADGSEVNPTKELLERNINTASVGKTSPRVGQTQVAGSLPTEARASVTAGGAPEIDKLLRSALGTKRSIATTTTTKSSGNTASVLHIEDADISKFTIGDIILVKDAGAYHVSPITAKSSGTGTATITLLVAHPDGDISDSVVIEKSTVYTVADSGHVALSVSKFIEGTITEKAMGCKVSSMALENFTTGQLPNFNFGFEGLDFDRVIASIPHTPSYSAALPPIVLDAKMFMDDDELEVNEFGFSLENALGFETATSDSNGRIASRVTERTITGNIDPYKADDNIDNFTKYQANTAFSLFGYAKVPTATPGEFNQIVAVYLPNCIITEMGESDQDGLLKDAITFSANRGNSGTTPEIYVAFI